MFLVAAAALLVYIALIAAAQLIRRGSRIRFGVTFHLFAAAAAVFAGLALSPWHGADAAAVRRHVGAAALVLAVFPITALLNRVLWRRAASGSARGETPRVLADATGIVLFAVAMLVVLEFVYGVQVPGLLAGSGVVALVLGLALQDMLANLFAGIALYLQKPFATGDWLLIDGRDARVIEVSWRSTRLVTTDDVLIDVPNSTIVKNTITNFERPSLRHAIRATFPLHDEVPPARAQAVLKAAAASVDGVCAEPAPSVHVKEFGPDAIVYEIKVWIEDHAVASRVLSDVRSHCWYAAHRAGLDAPFATIALRRAATSADAERARAVAAHALAAHPIFGFLGADRIDALVAESLVARFSPGEHVVEQDAPGESMFLVVRGHVDVVIRRDGRSDVVARLGPGECFGEMSVLTGEPRVATVVARGELEVVEITKDAVARLVTSHPDVITRLSELLGERQRANQEAAALATGGEAAEQASAGMLRRLRGFFQLG
ncbi:MAG TPA: mechanosensitive ion channel family protein [Vicinamibacterales bacterium]|nr:mechanosensitive ion channel family protein [Vicinamibacterales bacterium]